MKLRSGTPAEVGMSAAKIQHVANLARGWVEQGITPTLVVLVARRGVIVLHEAFGRLAPEADAPALPRDAIFFATAQDLAIFGQLFLNRGHYGDARILSPATVAAMTRNQIPGIGSQKDGEFFPEASWGLGWNIHGQKKATYDGTLYSPQAFSHGGGGGVQLWVDPVYELVGVYFSVVLRATADGLHPAWPVDLFINAVTAAVIDG